MKKLTAREKKALIAVIAVVAVVGADLYYFNAYSNSAVVTVPRDTSGNVADTGATDTGDNSGSSNIDSGNGIQSQPGCDDTAVHDAHDKGGSPLAVSWTVPQAIPDPGIMLDPNSGFAANDLYYKVGTVTSGTYAGGSIILAAITNEEGIYHFVMQGTKLTLLAQSSDIAFGGGYGDAPESTVPDYDQFLDCSKISIDTTHTLAGLVYPATVSHEGAILKGAQDEAVLSEGGMGGPGANSLYGFNFIIYNPNDYQDGTPMLFQDVAQKLVFAFSDSQLGGLYSEPPSSGLNNKGPLFSTTLYATKAPDGTMRVYTEQVPSFFASDYQTHFTWSDGTPGGLMYEPYQGYSCGGLEGMTTVVSVSPSDITPAGTTENGDAIYTFVDSQNPYLKDLYTYQNPDWGNGEKKISYDDWLAKRPLFLWRDPLGNLIEFQNEELFNGGGKCKPVIYLYPTATTTVSVSVAPVGGMTASIPAYGNGWSVTATPSGTIFSAGHSYPYLYWEGNGPAYTPQQGAVVAAGDVSAFFAKTLPALGLSSQEAQAFRSYWQPRMQSAPYYFVTFLPESSIDAAAPLSVTPAPDSVLRVFMEYKPLAAPVSVAPQSFTTPARTGFTVVEWGGAPI